MLYAGSEMLLADDIESFWLSGPSHSSADLAAGPSQLDRAHSHSSSALSRTASLAQSSGRHAAHSEGEHQSQTRQTLAVLLVADNS